MLGSSSERRMLYVFTQRALEGVKCIQIYFPQFAHHSPAWRLLRFSVCSTSFVMLHSASMARCSVSSAEVGISEKECK